jgi:hypothetical protein
MPPKSIRRGVDIRVKFKSAPFKADRQRKIAKGSKLLKEIREELNNVNRRPGP